MIRQLKDSDIPILRSFCKDFDFPDTSSPLIVVNGVFVDGEGKVQAYGQVKLTSEVFLVVNPDTSRVTKVDAIQDLFTVGKEMSAKKGLDNWLAFVKSGDSFMRMI